VQFQYLPGWVGGWWVGGGWVLGGWWVGGVEMKIQLTQPAGAGTGAELGKN
jgi:hypothetical protein